MDETQMLAAVRIRLFEKYGTQENAAKHLHISATYLSDILNRRRAVPTAVLERCAVRRVTYYEDEN